MDFSLELSQQQEALKRAAREFGEGIRAQVAAWDESNHAPIGELTREARQKGLTGITLPAEYGGQGLTAVEYLIVVEELVRAARWANAGEVAFRTSGAAPSIIMLSDNEEAKKQIIPQLAAGEVGAAIAMTEPSYGSAITDLETAAVPEGDYFVVNGTKRFITGAGEDDYYVAFVRFGNIPGAKGIGAILVEATTPGVTARKGPAFVGARGIPHGVIEFADARVPQANLLHSQGHFSRIMTAFNMERLHSAAVGLGISEACFDEAKKYALTRRQFGTEIVDFQAIQHALAEIWVNTEAIRFLTYRAAATAIEGKYPRGLEVSVAKYVSNTLTNANTSTALLLHGGDGCTMPFPIQRLWRDAMVLPIAGGTVHMLKNAIAQWIVPERRLARPRGGDGP